MSEMTVENIINELNKFPKNKPVKVLAANDNYEEDFPCAEEISSIGYAMLFSDEYEENGSPVFVEEDDIVYIFTEDYDDMMLMNGV